MYREAARGTFYLCAGKIDTAGPQGRIADGALIRRLSEAGHEIGCHTRSHLRAVDTPGATFRLDMAANRDALREQFGIAVRSFAYPYGSVTPAAKGAAAALYRTSRTTKSGINRGTFDANFLLANPLYGSATTDLVMALLRDCATHGGWLIFYAHDVSDRPSAYGCRPNLLQDVLRIATAEGCRIFPVGEIGPSAGIVRRSLRGRARAANCLSAGMADDLRQLPVRRFDLYVLSADSGRDRAPARVNSVMI